jgi:hypothetical protein
MPKLKLFRGTDPLESDAIPFPRATGTGDRFELRLTDSADAVLDAEDALDQVQRCMNDAASLLDNDWLGDDGPQAA